MRERLARLTLDLILVLSLAVMGYAIHSSMTASHAYGPWHTVTKECRTVGFRGYESEECR